MVESTIRQILLLLLLRTLFVLQDQLGYLKDLLDTRREVSSYPVSLYNKIHMFPLEVPSFRSIPVVVVFAIAVMSRRVSRCALSLLLLWCWCWCCLTTFSITWLVLLHLHHGRRLHGYILYRDCLKTSYEYMKPAYAGSIKDQCAADMVHRSSDIIRPHECSIIDQQSQYGDQQS